MHYSLRSCLVGSWLRKTLLLGLCSLILVLTVRALSTESVRAELIRLQRQNALSLISVTANKLNVVDYTSRSLKEGKLFSNGGLSNEGVLTVDGAEIAFNDCSPPGVTHPIPSSENCASVWPHLATIHADGTHFRQYSEFVYPVGMCWSHDKTKLALAVADRRENKSAVENVYILDLNSGQLQQVAGFDNWTMIQCWSADDKQFVYMENRVGGIQNVLVYDAEQRKSRFLAKGSHPTWSPDGKWISFLVNDETYNAVHPNGDGEKLLFKAGIGVTDLQWSPNSRFVAYVSARGIFERSLSEQFVELTRLRVRRLDDNSEEWFLNLTDTDPIMFQWVQGPNLVGNAQ
jgi:WD40 repeat protein